VNAQIHWGNAHPLLMVRLLKVVLKKKLGTRGLLRNQDLVRDFDGSRKNPLLRQDRRPARLSSGADREGGRFREECVREGPFKGGGGSVSLFSGQPIFKRTSFVAS